MFSVFIRLRRDRLRLWHVVFAAIWLGAPALAAGAEAAFTLRDAIRAALAHNPDLATFDFDLRINDAQRQQAALRPALEAEAGLENFAGTGAVQGLDESELTLSLSRVIELGGKRAARLGAVEASRAALRASRQAAQLDVLAEVTRRFIAVAEAQEQVRLAQRATELADETVRGTDVRVQAARAPHVELDRATVSAQRAQLELQSARSRLQSARHLLAAMWGAEDATLEGVPLGDAEAALFELPQPGEFAMLVTRLEQNPDLLRFASEERLREAELRLAATQRRADLTVGGGVRRLQSGGDLALVATVSIPLFAGKRADGAIAEATARRDAVGAERAAALSRARSALYALHQQLRDAVNIAESLQATAIPTLEEALDETTYAFERGRYGYLELVDAQREYLAVQSERIDASALAQTLAVEIERLTNAPLAEGTP